MRNFLFALCLTLGQTAWAATIHLKDGTRVRGTVVSSTARDVQVQTESGLRTFETDSLLRIDYSDAPPPEPARQERPRQRVDRHGWTTFDEKELSDSVSVHLGVATSMSRLGPSNTGGSSVRNGGTGLRIGVEYLHAMGPHLDLGLDVGFANRGEIGTDGLVPLTHSRTTGGMFAPLALMKLGLTTRDKPVRPYFTAGLGPGLNFTTIDAQPLIGYVWDDTGTDEPRRLVDDGSWGLATKAAFGLDFHPGSPSVVGIEVGWMGLLGDDIPGTAAGRLVGLDEVSGKVDQLTVTFHWGWRF